MNTTIKIVRAIWANAGSTHVFNEIPKTPTFNNQVVYVWGEDVERYIKQLGYETRLVKDNRFAEKENTEYGRKLIALDLALKEFGEVLLLDWDCYILRPLEGKFYDYLLSKETQCPLYAQHVNTVDALYEVFGKNHEDKEKFKNFAEMMRIEFAKYSWKVDDYLVSPNFGFLYTRDVELGKKLLDIMHSHNLVGCIEEHAMWIYANCSLDEYLERYHPVFVQGVSDDRTDHDFMISKVQRALNKLISEKINMDLYLKHI
jgi:hypothetical protein